MCRTKSLHLSSTSTSWSRDYWKERIHLGFLGETNLLWWLMSKLSTESCFTAAGGHLFYVMGTHPSVFLFFLVCYFSSTLAFPENTCLKANLNNFSHYKSQKPTQLPKQKYYKCVWNRNLRGLKRSKNSRYFTLWKIAFPALPRALDLSWLYNKCKAWMECVFNFLWKP